MDKRRKDIIDLQNVDIRHLENMFVVKEDSDGRYYYDLTDTIFMNPDTMNPLLFEEHEVTSIDTLYGLSLRYFDTRSLWWLVGVVNNINDPFDLNDMVGETIKIPIKSIVSEILTLVSS